MQRGQLAGPLPCSENLGRNSASKANRICRSQRALAWLLVTSSVPLFCRNAVCSEQYFRQRVQRRIQGENARLSRCALGLHDHGRNRGYNGLRLAAGSSHTDVQNDRNTALAVAVSSRVPSGSRKAAFEVGRRLLHAQYLAASNDARHWAWTQNSLTDICRVGTHQGKALRDAGGYPTSQSSKIDRNKSRRRAPMASSGMAHMKPPLPWRPGGSARR